MKPFRRRQKLKLRRAQRRGGAGVFALLPAAALVVSPARVYASEDATLSNDTLENIVVTASRREQKVSEVPFSIAAYGGDALTTGAIRSLGDLSKLSPGIASANPGTANRSNQNTIVIRGLNLSQLDAPQKPNNNVSPVATYFGETPVFFPMRFSDVDRVEVLRGPQGTLYGSGALAGAIRVIPKAPELGSWSGSIAGTSGKTNDSDGLNSAFAGTLNAPIIPDRLALRINVGRDNQAGWINGRGYAQLDATGAPVPRVANDPGSGFVLEPTARGINDSNVTYGRATLLWEGEQGLSAQLTYFRQTTTADAPDMANPGFPGGLLDNSTPIFPGAIYENTAGIPGGAFPNGGTVYPTGGVHDVFWLRKFPFHNGIDLAALELRGELPFGTLSSSTSWYQNSADLVTDGVGTFDPTRTPNSTNLAVFYGFYPRLTTDEVEQTYERSWTEELRLVSSGDSQLSYVAGLYYQKLSSGYFMQEFMPGVSAFDQGPMGSHLQYNPATGDNTYNQKQDFQFEDKAIFGELGYAITPKLKLTGGVRFFSQKFTNAYSVNAPFCGPYCANDGEDPLGGTYVPPLSKSFSDHILKANIAYQIQPDLLTYVLYSEGFRRGGVNGITTAGTYASLPQYATYAPDTVKNYEIGFKGSRNRQTFSLAAYYIDWKDAQVPAYSPSSGASYNVNLASARSIGLEAELSGRIDQYWDYRLGYSYTNAEATRSATLMDLPVGALLSDPPAPPVVTGYINKGDKLPGVPKQTIAADAGLTLPVGSSGWVFNWRAGLSYRSSVTTDVNPQNSSGLIYAVIGGFTVVNTSASISNDRWTATLAVDNLTDVLGVTGGAVNPANYGWRSRYVFEARPRTASLQLEYRFLGSQ